MKNAIIVLGNEHEQFPSLMYRISFDTLKINCQYLIKSPGDDVSNRDLIVTVG